MPLNTHEKDEFPVDEGPTPPPIRRQETPQGPPVKTVAIIVLLVALVGAGGYLLYRSKIFTKKSPPASVQTPPSQQPGLANPFREDSAASARTEAGTTPPAAPVAATPERGGASGKVTLYISSYRDRADAEEEAGRWSAAGFSSFVEDFNGWHRVAFGRFADMAAAEKEAERWKPAFEMGYWIGPSK